VDDRYFFMLQYSLSMMMGQATVGPQSTQVL
jgi:hypothetical protein